MAAITRRTRDAFKFQQCFQHIQRTMTSSAPIVFYDEVREALAEHRPVVALESTIVAHGMPYPQNLELSQDLANILRRKNVVPATIALRNGVCKIGLSVEELEDLAVAGQEGRAVKCTTRDLPMEMTRYASSSPSSSPQWGATTVASTMRLAALAGISTFVTGGIGGVHRGAEVSMDVSADLIELSRTPVIVVSAGIKSILDIPKTLEVLETYSVPTMSWKTDQFPAFFSPHSGCASPGRVDTADAVASAFLAGKELGLSGGILVAVPNEDPAGQAVEDAIQSSLQEATDNGISGQAVTPFILKRVAEKTRGESLRSNIALVKRNAEVGADIAIALSKMGTQSNR